MYSKSIPNAASSPQPDMVYTVSQLNLTARLLLEENFQTIWLVGELSNLSRPSSGHWYFSLKDDQAQVRCAFFRNHHRRINFTAENGLQVLVQAQVSLYEARGDYQLIILHMEIAGAGALQLAFEKLKQKLAKDGLFDLQHKKPIPRLPRTVGVVTSPTGAAIRDILKVLRRRFPSIGVIIYPTAVQGEKAAAQIAQALMIANERQECDVIILARGGGSLEDLWSFNEEIVARAIFASTIPIVSGIGHEVDVTIADFVADQRAATPSAAAEQVSPDYQQWLQTIQTFYQRFHHLIAVQLRHHRLQLTHLRQRLQHPGQRLQTLAQQLDQLEHRLVLSMQHRLSTQKQQLSMLAQSLQTVSPLATLQRGYAIIQNPKTQKIIYHTADVQVGDRVTAKLARGYLDCCVENIRENES